MNMLPITPPFPDAGRALAASFATSYAGVVAFMAVAAEGSFAKAGDRLGIGRSAVSRGIQKLETQLGARLFSRTTRRTALTREGELFRAHCQPGVEHITRALDSMRELREGPPRGHLRIASTTGFGRQVIAPLLAGFQAAYPEVELELLLDDQPVDFTAGRIDVAFREGRMEDSQIVAKQLIPMRLLVCASPAYAEAHGLPRSLDALEAHRCVNFRLGSGRVREWQFMEGGQPRKLTPRAHSTFNDAELVLRAVLEGRGIAQMAGYQVRDLLRESRLVECLARFAPDDRGHYVCYPSRQHLPARIRVFVEHMTAATRALDANDSVRASAGVPTAPFTRRNEFSEAPHAATGV